MSERYVMGLDLNLLDDKMLASFILKVDGRSFPSLLRRSPATSPQLLAWGMRLGYNSIGTLVGRVLIPLNF